MKRMFGFTLIELIIVIVIMSVLAASVAPMMIAAVDAYNASLNTVTTLDKLRYATERMARELREVCASTSCGGSSANFSFGTMGLTSVAFTQTTGRTVTIAQSGTTITITYSDVSGVTPVLVDQVSSVAFKYYAADGSTETASTSLVRYVEVSLTLSSQGTYSQRTRVMLRNYLTS